MSTDELSIKELYERALQNVYKDDDAVAARLNGILQLCSDAPRTVQELADYYEVHYQTMYKNVAILRALKFLQASPRKRNRQTQWQTNWVLFSKEGAELQWMARNGKFQPVSYWIDQFLDIGPKTVTRLMKNAGLAMVATHVNKTLMGEGENHYGRAHDFANRQLLEEAKGMLEGVVQVLDQAIASPIWDDDGEKLFTVPEGVKDQANDIHDNMEKFHQNSGAYEE